VPLDKALLFTPPVAAKQEPPVVEKAATMPRCRSDANIITLATTSLNFGVMKNMCVCV
jgi:hypothetical protein